MLHTQRKIIISASKKKTKKIVNQIKKCTPEAIKKKKKLKFRGSRQTLNWEVDSLQTHLINFITKICQTDDDDKGSTNIRASFKNVVNPSQDFYVVVILSWWCSRTCGEELARRSKFPFCLRMMGNHVVKLVCIM